MIDYTSCTLCAHACGVDRTQGKSGRCHMTATPKVARAALHLWEEPPITGKNGSGTIFFSGCSLSCLFCQNREISRASVGKSVSNGELVEMMLKLQEDGAANINFVTPTHHIPTLSSVIPMAKAQGLIIPIVYNTSSYERPEALKMLDGLVDIYLPDLKYIDSRLAKRYSGTEDYPEVAMRAIGEMMRQCPTPIFTSEKVISPASAQTDESPLMLRGVVARVLILPAATANAKLAISHLYRTYGDNMFISILGQYTPIGNLPSPLNRKITTAEYDEVVSYATRLGVRCAFVQSLDVANESFIPDFETNS